MTPKITSNPAKNLITSLPKKYKPIVGYINLQEAEGGSLSKLRIGQELATNLGPKALFARGLVDLCDNAFREIIEVAIVYLAPKFLGEKFKSLYTTKNAQKGFKEAIAIPAAKLLKENNLDNKKLMPVKAAIAVSALLIPVAEYALSYAKNLFTLKTFKQADFNNIANLNKNKKEDTEKQKFVEKSAKSHIKKAGAIYAGFLGFSALLLAKGKNSKVLNSISEAILAPGSKFFKKNEKLKNIVNQYFGLDFASKNGKLAISNGQITASVLAGFFGYTGAAKDRGKQDYKEVLYRFPLVGLYAITGSDLIEKGFVPLMKKKGKCKELFEESDKIGRMPKLNELEDLAQKLSFKNKTTAKFEFERLFKQKSALMMTPFVFGITVMGLFVAGLSRYFTQYRYNKENGKK